MSNRFALGRKALGICDLCGLTFKLKELRGLVVKTKPVNMLVCRQCWVPDHPQLQVGMYPVHDPQALRRPRPDNTYWQAGMTGLQIAQVPPADPDNVLAFGQPSGGSRVIQWGWNPVGFSNVLGLPSLVDVMEMRGEIGQVEIDLSPKPLPTMDGVSSIGGIGAVSVVTNVGTLGGTSGISGVGTVVVTTI